MRTTAILILGLAWMGRADAACSSACEKFIRGDVNDDSTVDNSDLAYLAAWLFQSGNPPPGPWDTGDTNDDGELDISDTSYLSNFLYLGGPEPPPPFKSGGWYSPGLDITIDDIDEECDAEPHEYVLSTDGSLFESDPSPCSADFDEWVDPTTTTWPNELASERDATEGTVTHRRVGIVDGCIEANRCNELQGFWAVNGDYLGEGFTIAQLNSGAIRMSSYLEIAIRSGWCAYYCDYNFYEDIASFTSTGEAQTRLTFMVPGSNPPELYTVQVEADSPDGEESIYAEITAGGFCIDNDSTSFTLLWYGTDIADALCTLDSSLDEDLLLDLVSITIVEMPVHFNHEWEGDQLYELAHIRFEATLRDPHVYVNGIAP